MPSVDILSYKWIVAEYREEQGIERYDEMNRAWRDIVLKKRPPGTGRIRRDSSTVIEESTPHRRRPDPSWTVQPTAGASNGHYPAISNSWAIAPSS